MKKIIITESQLQTIIEEVLPIGKLAARARKLPNIESINDAIVALKNEAEMLETFDEIYKNASKRKNISELETLEARLIHMFAPSSVQDEVNLARVRAFRILNGYAILREFESWDELKTIAHNGGRKKSPLRPPEPKRTEPKRPEPTEKQNKYYSPEYEELANYYREILRRKKEQEAREANKPRNLFSKRHISDRVLTDEEWSKFLFGKKIPIDWSKIKFAKTPEEYNKIIANAIDSADYKYISKGGFENFGVEDFQELLRNKIVTVNDLNPETGRWLVLFK